MLLVFKLQQPRGGHSSLQGGCNVHLKACTRWVSDGCPCSRRQVFSKITVVARRICQDQRSSLVQSLDASTQNQQWRVRSTSMHQLCRQVKDCMNGHSKCSFLLLDVVSRRQDLGILLGPRERVEKAEKDRALRRARAVTDLFLLPSVSIYSAGISGLSCESLRPKTSLFPQILTNLG